MGLNLRSSLAVSRKRATDALIKRKAGSKGSAFLNPIQCLMAGTQPGEQSPMSTAPPIATHLAINQSIRPMLWTGKTNSAVRVSLTPPSNSEHS